MSQRVYGYSSPVRKRRRRRKIRRIKHMAVCVLAVLFICIGIRVAGKNIGILERDTAPDALEVQAEKFVNTYQSSNKKEAYPEYLVELLEKNPETYDFVEGYPDRSKYQGMDIDIKGDVTPGKVPLFLQWDMRWGYDNYGQEMIAIAGCGPACMSMAYVYLTGDTTMNPREMAEFANDGGYYTEAGTSWDFFTDGAAQLGLQGAEIGLDEVKMKQVLDNGKVIICSMRPGDFTTTGHFILICGYDNEGFLVNDPNSKENSEKKWSFETLNYQIKCLWSIGE